MADRDSALRVLTALREGYAPVTRQVEIGLARLLSILENLDG